MQSSLIIVIVVAPPKFVKTHYYIFKGCKYNLMSFHTKSYLQTPPHLKKKLTQLVIIITIKIKFLRVQSLSLVVYVIF